MCNGESLSTLPITRRQELLGQHPASTTMSHLIIHNTNIVRHNYCKPRLHLGVPSAYTRLLHVSCCQRRGSNTLVSPLTDARPSSKRACRSSLQIAAVQTTKMERVHRNLLPYVGFCGSIALGSVCHAKPLTSIKHHFAPSLDKMQFDQNSFFLVSTGDT
jgi:hypothetical protein